MKLFSVTLQGKNEFDNYVLLVTEDVNKLRQYVKDTLDQKVILPHGEYFTVGDDYIEVQEWKDGIVLVETTIFSKDKVIIQYE